MPKWLILFALVLVGCASSVVSQKSVASSKPAIFSARPSNATCAIEGANDFERQFIFETLSIMPSAVQRSIDKIIVHREKTPEFGKTIAYCSAESGKREIHFLRDHLHRANIWHEATHAFDYKLGMEDDAEWLRVVGDGLWHIEGRNYPSRGVLNGYSTKNWLEDRATWVEFVYMLRTGARNIFSEIPDIDDVRYRQKLDLLLKQGFIDSAAHEMASSALRKEAGNGR